MKCMDCRQPIDKWVTPLRDGDVVVHADCDLDAVIAARDAAIENEIDLWREVSR